MPQSDRREPSKPRNVEDIDPQSDVRVRILGTVLEKRDDSVVMDDGTGTVEVFLDGEELDTIKDGQRIRIFGRVLPTRESFELQADIVQDMTDLDMEDYNAVRDAVGLEQIP